MTQKAETSVCDWSVCPIHTVWEYTKSSPLGGLVPLYSRIVAEEDLMNVVESP